MYQRFIFLAASYCAWKLYCFYRKHYPYLPKQYRLLPPQSTTKLKKPKRNPIRDGFTKRKIPTDLDVIVIGSGISGLTTAALLSRVGKKVLVLEQHYIAGGCTHTYEDKGFEFDTGIHYVGNVQKYQPLLDCITEHPIQWQQMGYKDYECKKNGANIYDEIYLGEGDSTRIYRLRAGVDSFINDLIGYFPEEEEVIRKYVSLVQSSSVKTLYFKAKVIKPRWFGRLIQQYACDSFYSMVNQTAHEVISSLTKNQELIAVLCGQFGDYGPPPTQAPFYMHAAVVNHYLKGGYYPIGGTSVFAREMVPIIEQSGGRVLVRKKVSRILLDSSNTKAIGIEMENGIKIYAPQIVSSVGLTNTFTRLLLPQYSPQTLLDNIQSLGLSSSMMYLTVGFNRSTDELELPSSNLWIWPHSDYERLLSDFAKDPAHAPIPLFMGFPSAKDSSWSTRYPHRSTAVIITMIPSDMFEEWKDTTRWNRRPDDYKQLKDIFQKRMLEKLYELFPHTKEALEYCSMGTPLTFNHFLNTINGETYGVSVSPNRYSKNDWIVPRTHIQNLFQTGQDLITIGFTSGLSSAVLTVSDMLGYGTILDIITDRSLVTDIQHLSKKH